MTAKSLKAASTKGDIALTPGKSKDDYVLAALLTIARKSTRDGRGDWDTSRLFGTTSKLSTATKRALQTKEAIREWADFVFTYRSDPEEDEEEDAFAVDEKHCPILFGLVRDFMTLKQMKRSANKCDTPPGSSSKTDYAGAVLQTAGRRAAQHVMESKSRRKTFGKTFEELLSILPADGKRALNDLSADDMLRSSLEWVEIVRTKLFELMGARKLRFDADDSPAMNTRSRT